MTDRRVAIVTGGASGLGRALCVELAREGMLVVVADLNEATAHETVATLTASGGQAEAVQLDVTSQPDVDRVVEEIAARHGRLDFMFNNAGFAIAGDTIEMTPDQWRRILAVNVEGCIWGTMAAYRVMAKQRFGHIVNTASFAGLSPLPLSTPYSMTKFAVVGLTRSMRYEAAWYGVKMSVACPGFIATKLFDSGVGLGNVPFRETTAMGVRLAIPPERAAKLMLRGVRKNLDIIVFPFHGQMIALMQRVARWAGKLVGHRVVANFHRKRQRTPGSVDG
ncbi:MAG: SDR family oxidoreductase, partial [Candidatus Saccharimonas sp.]|nr:SDR family oxidoreductase [Planctomycetaceae bacterium]